MSTPERDAALAADETSRHAFNNWQREPRGENREVLKRAYERATERAKQLWAIVGPDPLVSQLQRAQEVTDAEEGHDADGRR